MNQDKVKGMIVGGALGDALGASWEHTRETITFANKLDKWIYRSRFQGVIVHDAGQVTDDTEMMLIIARHIAKHGHIVTEQLVLDYLSWTHDSKHLQGGATIRSLLCGVKTYKGYLNRYSKIDPQNQSNGSLMRAACVSLLDESEWLKDSRITNIHKNVDDTVMFYLHLLRGLLTSVSCDSKESIVKSALAKVNNQEVRDAITGERRDIKENKGWCLHTIHIAIYCFLHFNTYTEAVSYCINEGGDTDTNACVLGCLFGAYVGYDTLYAEQRENVEKVINCTTEGGDRKRKAIYRLNDIDSLVDSLVSR